MKKKRIPFLTLSVLALVTPFAQGAVIVYEGFSGYTAGNLIGQSAQGTGETGTWEQRFSGLAQSYAVNATGLTYGTLATSGGRLDLGSSSTSAGTAVLPLSASAIAAANPAANTSITLWMSFILQTPSSLGGTATVGFGRDLSSVGWGTGVIARDPSGYGNRIDTNSVVGGSVATNTNYFYLSEITLDNTDGDAQWEIGSMQTWQYSGGTLPSVAPTTGGVSSSFTTSSDRRLQAIYIQPGNISGTYNLDEIRLATTFNEALGVPEPSTFALLGLGFFAVFGARRRAVNPS